ncbi:MAG: acyl carrier protein [Candidatus Nitrosotenuis sp.]
MTNKLFHIISQTLNVPVSEINDESGPETVESWDSFNLYVLLDEIETAYNVKFNLDETLEIKSVGHFKKLLQKHGVAEL